MKTLHLFQAAVGTAVRLRMSSVTGIIAYAAVLERIPGGVASTWLPQQLEGAGGSDVLGSAQGHNIITLPVIAKEGAGSMRARLELSDGQGWEDAISVPDNEPFGWRIFMV